MPIESSDGETLDPIKRVDNSKLGLQVGNDDGTIRNITNDTLVFEARLKVADEVPLFTKTSNNELEINKYDAPNGKAWVYINPDDTEPLTKDVRLACQLEVIDNSGNVDTTMFTLPVTFRR